MEIFLLVPGGQVCDAAVAGERSVHHLIEVLFGDLAGFGRFLGFGGLSSGVFTLKGLQPFQQAVPRADRAAVRAA